MIYIVTLSLIDKVEGYEDELKTIRHSIAEATAAATVLASNLTGKYTELDWKFVTPDLIHVTQQMEAEFYHHYNFRLTIRQVQ